MGRVLYIRVPDKLHGALARRAERNGRPMAEEARAILERELLPREVFQVGAPIGNIGHSVKV